MRGGLPRLLKGLLLVGVSVALLAFVLTRVDRHQVVAVFRAANPLALLATAAFSLSAFLLMPTWRWKNTLNAMGYSTGFWRLVFIRLGAQPMKFTIPLKGGEAFRALYLQRRHGVALTAGLASILFDIFLVAVGQLSLLTLGVALAGSATLQPILLPTIGVFGLGLLLSSRRAQALLGRATARLSPRLSAKYEALAHGFLRFPLHTKLALVAISLLVELSEILSMAFACRALGLDVPLWAILAYMPIVMGVTLIPITLRGLGTRELAILVLFGAHGSPEQLTSAALLFTFVEFILPALVGCLFLSPFLADLAQKPLPEAPPRPPDPTPGPIWRFLATHKRWWLLPGLLVFALLALLAWLTDTGSLHPFIY